MADLPCPADRADTVQGRWCQGACGVRVSREHSGWSSVSPDHWLVLSNFCCSEPRNGKRAFRRDSAEPCYPQSVHQEGFNPTNRPAQVRWFRESRCGFRAEATKWATLLTAQTPGFSRLHWRACSTGSVHLHTKTDCGDLFRIAPRHSAEPLKRREHALQS